MPAAAHGLPSNPQRTIAIAGAGIGGLTAALALAASGFAVSVFERAEQLSEVGAGIQLGPNARRVLDRLGLGPALSARAIEPAAIDIRNGVGGNLVTSVRGSSFHRRYGAAYGIIHRADLQAVLLNAVVSHPAITLKLNAEVTGVDEVPGGLGVRVEVAGERQTLAAEALIGADGVWSETRRRVRPTARPVLTGRSAWRAVVPIAAGSGLAADHVGLWLGPNAHLVHYPVSGGASLNLVAVVEDPWREAGWDGPGDSAVLTQHFREWSPAARALIASSTNWRRFALFSVPADDAWTAGRIALLGDAAHAMMPFLAQGAAMAIEDAAVLANALTSFDDVPMALAAYERARRPRAQSVAETSQRTGAQYHWAGAARTVRDGALALIGERLILDRYDWIYRWRAPAEGALSA